MRALLLAATVAAAAGCSQATGILVTVTAPGAKVVSLEADVSVAATGRDQRVKLPANGAPLALPGALLVELPDVATPVTVALAATDDAGGFLTANGEYVSVAHRQLEPPPLVLARPGGGDGGAPADLGAADAGPRLLFSDEFSGDLSAWMAGGNGVWSVAGGEATQSNAAAAYAVLYAPSTSALADYHVVSRMRETAPSGGALEITFRLTTTPLFTQYFCNWEPATGNLLIMSQQQEQTAKQLQITTVDTSTIAGYTPAMPVTMHVVAQGDLIRCWLDEIPGAALSALDKQYASGAVGLKTYAIAAAYDFVRVYEAP